MRIFADNMRNGYVMFALGMPPHVFGLALIPVSVFYLTLERICIIRFPAYFNFQKPKILYVFYALTICVGISTVSVGFYKAFLLLKPEMRIHFCFILLTNLQIFSLSNQWLHPGILCSCMFCLKLFFNSIQ